MANVIKAPLPGTILGISVAVGDSVNVGNTVLVLEAMKMENNIPTDFAGTVTAILVAAGDIVSSGQALVEID